LCSWQGVGAYQAGNLLGFSVPGLPGLLSPDDAIGVQGLCGYRQGLRRIRHYPQDSHPYAVPAARYGQAALRVGIAQWNKVADALFSNQDVWGESGDIATVLSKTLTKQDMDAVQKELKNEDAIDSAIYADIQSGIARNVDSTPTFFISAGGKTETVAAALTYAAMKQYFDEKLGK